MLDPEIAERPGHRTPCAAGAQQHGAFAGGIEGAVLGERAGKSQRVGVVANEPAGGGVHRVDGPQTLGGRRAAVDELGHANFMGNGHVEAAPFAPTRRIQPRLKVVGGRRHGVVRSRDAQSVERRLLKDRGQRVPERPANYAEADAAAHSHSDPRSSQKVG